MPGAELEPAIAVLWLIIPTCHPERQGTSAAFKCLNEMMIEAVMISENVLPSFDRLRPLIVCSAHFTGKHVLKSSQLLSEHFRPFDLSNDEEREKFIPFNSRFFFSHLCLFCTGTWIILANAYGLMCLCATHSRSLLLCTFNA